MTPAVSVEIVKKAIDVFDRVQDPLTICSTLFTNANLHDVHHSVLGNRSSIEEHNTGGQKEKLLKHCELYERRRACFPF